MKSKTNLELFTAFFKIGATTFGGGYAMLPVIRREVVEKHNWLSSEEFIDMLAIAQSFPGAIAINSAVFIGQKRHGLTGAVSALLGSVLPSFIVILTIAVFCNRFIENPVAIAAFAGIRPAVAALVAAAVIKIGKPVFKDSYNVVLIVLFLIATLVLDFHPAAIMLLGAIFGLLPHWITSRQAAEKEYKQ